MKKFIVSVNDFAVIARAIVNDFLDKAHRRFLEHIGEA